MRGHQPDDLAAPRSPCPPGADRISGDRIDFDRFFQTWYSRLSAQMHAYLGDRTEAEDVTQEAFLRAWQRWSAISSYQDPVAWVRRVAWNLSTSRLRRITTAARALRRQRAPEPVPDANPDHVALVAALRRLPERHRRVIVLHYIGDVPVAEIAVGLGVPKGTVVSWLHRGRAELAVHLTGTDMPTAPGDDPRAGSGEAVTS